jgi:hypothetical protein
MVFRKAVELGARMPAAISSVQRVRRKAIADHADAKAAQPPELRQGRTPLEAVAAAIARVGRVANDYVY